MVFPFTVTIDDVDNPVTTIRLPKKVSKFPFFPILGFLEFLEGLSRTGGNKSKNLTKEKEREGGNKQSLPPSLPPSPLA